MEKYILFFFLLTISFQSLQAQTPEQEQREHEQRKQKQAQAVYDSIPKPVSPTARADTPIVPLPKFPNKKLVEAKKVRREAQAKLKELRAPHPDDLNKYKDFLKLKNAGLFKLFPDLECDSKFIVKVDGDCEKTVQDSYSYSFQKRLYSDSVFHDIRLDEDRLWLDGFLSQSIITDLGDIPLENVTLQNNYADFLTNFKPSFQNDESKKQFWEIAKKIQINGFIYGKVVKLILNTTYLARIINYQIDEDHQVASRIKRAEKEEEIPFLIAAFDKQRLDTIVAFRVVRIDSDNSISILWKQIAEKRSPRLKFEKDEKWTDFKIK